ncbi:hypothetical protein GCM10010244_82660 [Streptomyces coeruleorubidus]|nr:hypothetical protein GCM10010244_82660 [Streptomyces bellus]
MICPFRGHGPVSIRDCTQASWRALLGRVNTPDRGTLRYHRGVVLGMKPINEAHLSEAGLAVVEVAAIDDQTAFAFQELLAGRGRPRRWTVHPGPPASPEYGCAATWTFASSPTCSSRAGVRRLVSVTCWLRGPGRWTWAGRMKVTRAGRPPRGRRGGRAESRTVGQRVGPVATTAARAIHPLSQD